MTRPVCILIAAMGGEGGGVLADWLIEAATRMDFPVQSTSVPGVAQRTGATTYYVEIFPVPRSQLHGREPVLSLTPTVGEVDLVAASELVEAGRAIQSGFVHPARTVLVASTHREYAVSEKSAMGDGRYDARRILDAAPATARDCVLFDMRASAQQLQTVINTVLFGAMASSGVLPLSREACEEAIRHSGKAVEASLRGFAAGFDRVSPGTSAPERRITPLTLPERVRRMPAELRDTVASGIALTSDYQDGAYAGLYLDRVERIVAADSAGGPSGHAVTRETARYLALWMSFEDVIRVADLKTRQDRLERVRREVGAKPDEPLQITEFLKPGVDELCSVLPTSIAEPVRRWLLRRRRPLVSGLHLRTDTVKGFLALVALRSLRPLRRRMSRYATEQQAIERWLGAVVASLPHGEALALEVALCGNLVKGYGETHARGHRSLTTILDDLQRQVGSLTALPGGAHIVDLAARVRTARVAALGDPQGRQLAGSLGLPPPEPVAQPITFHRRRPAT
ncbi:MAG: indolepyruvate oxidoreductase subunit beta family protein [Proteobacteria bacterium]|nr:indolepyruvate oxidoreductase subunit beta family protein [Pseudomonadota bacterium]